MVDCIDIFIYFKTFSAPTIETLFLLVLSILAMESACSVRSLYRHFLSGITKKSLNAFYYACSHAKADYSRFMNVTASMALNLIPMRLRSQPVFLCIDDTMNLRTYQSFLTMQHIMAQIISMDTVLSASCSVSRYGIKAGSVIFQSRLDTACDRRRNPGWSWPQTWYAR